MREYSAPAGKPVADDENMSDVVWANAERFSDVVSFRRQVDGTWLDVTAKEFAGQVLAVAKGMAQAGIGRGDRVAHHVEDPLRVDADRLRDLGGRRGHGADLRHLLPRTGALDPLRLGREGCVRRDERPRRGRRRDPGPAHRAGPHLADRGRLPRRRRAGRDRRFAVGRRAARAPPRGDRRRARHDRLHLGHHRPPQGRRADPPQPAGRDPRRHRGVPAADGAGQLAAGVPAAGARAGPRDRRRPRCPPASPSGTPRTSRTWSPTWAPSGRRSSSRCRACSRRSTTRRSRRPTATARARSSTPPRRSRSPTARRRTRAAPGSA